MVCRIYDFTAYPFGVPTTAGSEPGSGKSLNSVIVDQHKESNSGLEEVRIRR